MIIGAFFWWWIAFGLLHARIFALDDSIFLGGPHKTGKDRGRWLGRRGERYDCHFVGCC